MSKTKSKLDLLEVGGRKIAYKDYLDKKIAWFTKQESSETFPIVSDILLKDLEKVTDDEEMFYHEVFTAMTDEQKHNFILEIHAARQDALKGTTEEVVDPNEDADDLEFQVAKEEALKDPYAEEDEFEDKKQPRKKGYLELEFDRCTKEYVAKGTYNEKIASQIFDLAGYLEIGRRYRFFYDIQKLRVAVTNRNETYAREFGRRDFFIDRCSEQFKRIEKHNEKMVERSFLRSKDAEIFAYIKETYLGIGTMMAAAILAEVATPFRFHSLSSIWKYAGLDVTNHDPETGEWGRAPRRRRGEKATWNHQLRNKLLGVAAGCIIKAQTRYVGTPEESTKARNVKCLNDYKHRIIQKNNLVPEKFRVYKPNGEEVFQAGSTKSVPWFDKNGNKVTREVFINGTCVASDGIISREFISRRSPGHINNMAKRYMMKMFVLEVVNKWRELKGAERFIPYDEAKLRGGVKHKGLPANQPRF